MSGTAQTLTSDVERTARVALTRIAEPGDTALGRCLAALGPVELLRVLAGGADLPKVSQRRMAGYRLRLPGIDPAADLATMDRLGGRFVCPGDVDWPGQLDDLGEQRPIGLWVLGKASLRLWALRSVAVVGARACTAYGAHVASTLAADLAEAGWAVVSGAAYGVDGAAHRGVLSVGGPTIAVGACGVDFPYPRGHAELLLRISRQGLVIAELPPGEHPRRSRFIVRNRVIAALSRGTVVVEAGYRSGALSTARRAQELGRFAIAVPGPVTSPLSAGTHQLIRGGAELVTDAAEVVELVGRIGADLAPQRQGPVVARDLLQPQARQVLDALPARAGETADAVARSAGVSLDETLGRLHELLPLGFAEREGQLWRLAARQEPHSIR